MPSPKARAPRKRAPEPAPRPSPRMTREPDENYFDMELFDKSRSVKNWVLFPDAYPEKRR